MASRQQVGLKLVDLLLGVRGLFAESAASDDKGTGSGAQNIRYMTTKYGACLDPV